MNTYLGVCLYLFKAVGKFHSLLPYYQPDFCPEVVQKSSLLEDSTTYHSELTCQKSHDDATWSLVLPSSPYIQVAMEQYYHLLLWNETEDKFIN